MPACLLRAAPSLLRRIVRVQKLFHSKCVPFSLLSTVHPYLRYSFNPCPFCQLDSASSHPLSVSILLLFFLNVHINQYSGSDRIGSDRTSSCRCPHRMATFESQLACFACLLARVRACVRPTFLSVESRPDQTRPATAERERWMRK